ncbi:unnamed protein product [Ectocarpus sp. 13 AM-2016]
MELEPTGVVGQVVHGYEQKRPKSLEQLATARKAATKAVEKASFLLQPKAAVRAENVARGQTQVDRAARWLKEDTRDLEHLSQGWANAYADLSKELVLMGDMKAWTETLELKLRSVKAELEHSKGCMVAWQRLNDEDAEGR